MPPGTAEDSHMNAGIQGNRNRDPGLHAPVPMPVYLRIVTAFLIGVVLFFLTNGLRSNNLLLVFAALAVPVGLLLIQNARGWFVWTLGLFYSGLYLPGFPKSLDLFHASAMGLVPVLVATSLIRPQRFGFYRGLKILAACFMGVILLTIQQRGFGISSFGGTMWGGASYIYMGLAFATFFFGDSTVLQTRQWRHVLILMLLLGMLPPIAEGAFLFSHGRLPYALYFIRQEGSISEPNLDALLGGQGVFRLKALNNTVYVFVLALALWPYRGRFKKRLWTAGIVGGTLVGLSGHRTHLFILVAMVPFLAYLTNRRSLVRILVAYSAAFALIMTFLAFWGKTLPLSIQRTVAWVPFADISPVASQSAAGTLEGRFEMWQILLRDYVPRYWLLGRGFGFSAEDLLSLRASAPRIATYIVTNSYHNGPLVLLVNLGIGGLLSGYAFMFIGLWRHGRLLSRPWASEALARYHRVMLAFCALAFVAAAATGCGDWITELVLLMLILEGLALTNRRLLAEGKENSPSRSADRSRDDEHHVSPHVRHRLM